MASRTCLSMAMVLVGVAGWGGQLAPGWATTTELEAEVDTPFSEEFSGDAIAQNPNSQGYAVLHVNSSGGDDIQGIGSQMKPLRTITHALRIARPNTLILLASGTYSVETGETFPLQLKSGVTIQGAAGPNAADVVIQGGARFISPSRGLRSVAILGADNAGLGRVTVSNPQPNGVGLWIESGSPIIQENAFFRNGSTGIYIAGGGSPVIRKNYFSENGDAGLVIAGPSSAQVQNNIFENTGTGISVAPGATPQISDNRISHNLDGLVLHADARPVLQNNQIRQNRRNSILDYAPWSDTTTASTSQATQPPPPSPPSVAVAPPQATPQALIANETVAPNEAPAALPEVLPGADSETDETIQVVPISSETTEAGPERSSNTAETSPVVSERSSNPAETSAAVPERSPDIAEASPVVSERSSNPAETSAAVSERSPDILEANGVLPPERSPGLSEAPSAPPEETAQALETPSTNPDATADVVETETTTTVADSLPAVPLNSPENEIATEPEATSPAPAVELAVVPAVPLEPAFSNLDLSSTLELPESVASEESANIEEDSAESVTVSNNEEPAETASSDRSRLLSLIRAARDRRNQSRQPSQLDSNSEAIEIPIIPPPVDTVATPQQLPQVASESSSPSFSSETPQNIEDWPELPPLVANSTSADVARIIVPGSDIPMGSGGDLPEIFTTGNGIAASSGNPPPPPSLASALGLTHRLFVPVEDEATRNRVRQLVPDAFRVSVNGQTYMQVGAYATSEEAYAKAEQLNQQGLRVQVERFP